MFSSLIITQITPSVPKVQHACWGQSRSKRREKANAIISQIVNVALEAALFSVLSEEGQLGQGDRFASHRRSLGAVFFSQGLVHRLGGGQWITMEQRAGKAG